MPPRAPISQVSDDPFVVPVYNDSGGARAAGDVMCWQVSTTARQNVESPAADNLALAAGVVTADGIPATAFGYLYRQGRRPVDAKVLGSPGLSAGDPLEPVAGQVYLRRQYAAPLNRSYSLQSESGSTGYYYNAGFYEAPAADANLTQASTSVTLGAANVPYAANVFIVAGGAGAASGGSGAVTMTVTGTSITDGGTRTLSDSETVVADITALATNGYAETSKKWLGQVTIALDAGATGHTAYSLDFNYGWANYEVFGNQASLLTDFECVGFAGANDGSFDIELIHHKATGWTYHATAFVPGPTPLLKMSDVYSTESDIDSGVPFAFKRTGLTEEVASNATEGLVIRATTGANGAIEFMDSHITVKLAVPIAGRRVPFVLAENYATTSAALKKVYVDCPL